MSIFPLKERKVHTDDNNQEDRVEKEWLRKKLLLSTMSDLSVCVAFYSKAHFKTLLENSKRGC